MYNHYGPGFGVKFNHPLYEHYRKEIQSDLTIVLDGTENEELILKILKESLENKKTFYENAPEKIKKSMREYKKLTDQGVLF